MLAGVAGPADHHLLAVPPGDRVAHVAVVGRQAEPVQQLGGTRSLHREHTEVVVLVGDRDPGRRGGGQPTDHLAGVRRIRHQEDVVVGEQVRDQVVHYAAGGRVATQRVLRLARLHPVEIVRQRAVDEVPGGRAAHPRLAEVGDVEDPDRLPDRGVLAQDTTPGGAVLDRHLPAAEVGELGAEGDVPVVQRGAQQVGHAGSLPAPTSAAGVGRRGPAPRSGGRRHSIAGTSGRATSGATADRRPAGAEADRPARVAPPDQAPTERTEHRGRTDPLLVGPHHAGCGRPGGRYRQDAGRRPAGTRRGGGRPRPGRAAAGRADGARGHRRRGRGRQGGDPGCRRRAGDRRGRPRRGGRRWRRGELPRGPAGGRRGQPRADRPRPGRVHPRPCRRRPALARAGAGGRRGVAARCVLVHRLPDLRRPVLLRAAVRGRAAGAGPGRRGLRGRRAPRRRCSPRRSSSPATW